MCKLLMFLKKELGLININNYMMKMVNRLKVIYMYRWDIMRTSKIFNILPLLILISLSTPISLKHFLEILK